MANKIIQLTITHRGGSKSYTFAGRDEGKAVRKALDLPTKDYDNFIYTIEMPRDTTSFNPSFYLGLLFDSITNLKGIDKFKEKYILDLNSIDAEFRPFIEEDISECERKAKNEYLNLKR